ncbi:MAG: hypothetical protein AAFR61_09975 [Bacteroidota bacterium]
MDQHSPGGLLSPLNRENESFTNRPSSLEALFSASVGEATPAPANSLKHTIWAFLPAWAMQSFMALLAVALVGLGMGLGTRLISFTQNTSSYPQAAAPRGLSYFFEEDTIKLSWAAQSQVDLQIQINRFGGDTLYRRSLLADHQLSQLSVDVSFLPDGLYLMRASGGDSKLIRLFKKMSKE